MRKVISIFTLALLMLGFGACSDGDEDDVLTRQFQVELLNNSVNIGENKSDKVTTSVIDINWNITNSTMSMNCPVQLSENTNANLVVNNAKLVIDNSLECYTFSSATGGNGITDVKGFYDPGNKTFQINYVANGTHRVYSSAMLRFPYMSCEVSDLTDDNLPVAKSDNAAMVITINPADMSANLAMGQFNLSQSTGINQVTFNGLHAEGTADGYNITFSGEQKSINDSYILNNFEANVTNGGRNITGTFVINGEKYKGIFKGTEFAQ